MHPAIHGPIPPLLAVALPLAAYALATFILGV